MKFSKLMPNFVSTSIASCSDNIGLKISCMNHPYRFVFGSHAYENITPPMNEPEVQSAKDADEKAVNEATTKRLNLLLGIVSQKFNLGDDYHVCQFNDKGKVMNITLENEDFAVAVTVKDSERHGLVVEQ